MLQSNIITKDNKWSHYINQRNTIKIEDIDSVVVRQYLWESEKKSLSSDNLNKISKAMSHEQEINNVFAFYKEVFPNKRILNDIRKTLISNGLKRYSIDELKKAIQSRSLAIELSKLKGYKSDKPYDDIQNIFNKDASKDNLKNNIESYDARLIEYSELLKKSGGKEIVQTEIFRIMKRFVNGTIKGAMELNCFTGAGKTFSAVNFMMDFIRNDTTNKITFFFAKQKTNLESPRNDLLNSVTDEEKEKIFQFNSTEDLCETLNVKGSAFHSLFKATLDNKRQNIADKLIFNIQEKRKNNRFSIGETFQLYESNIKSLRKMIAECITKEKYESLNLKQKDALFELFPLNKITSGDCKVVFATIDKAILPSHGIKFNNDRARIVVEKLTELKKNGIPRMNDIYILDESQHFVPTINKRHVEDSVSFDMIKILRGIGDRFITACYEEHEHDLKEQIELIKTHFSSVFNKYKLNNDIKVHYENKSKEEKYSYLINQNENILSLKEVDDLYYVVEDEYSYLVISKGDISNGETIFHMKDVLHDFKSVIFRFNKIIATSYKMFLKEKAKDGEELVDPISKYIIEKKIDHTKLDGYVKTLVGFITPNKSKEIKSICDIYSILNEKIQTINIRNDDNENSILELGISEGDGNQVLAKIAANNYVFLMSGTANSRTVINNCHIEYLKHTLSGYENCDYHVLDVNEETRIINDYRGRLPLLSSINRNIITCDVKSISNWEYLLDLRLSSIQMDIRSRSYFIQQIKSANSKKDEFICKRLFVFIDNMINFLNNDNS